MLQAVRNCQSYKSYDEFMLINGSHVALSSAVIVLVTKSLPHSPRVVEEILFCIWMNKKIISVMFDNVWNMMPLSLKCLLG